MNENLIFLNENTNTPEAIISDSKSKISKILSVEYPDHLDFEDGSFALSHGSTQVMIVVRNFNEDEACIDCISHVVTGATVTADLMNFLLRKNSELHFGAFGLMFDGTVTFAHSFSSKCLDAGELSISLKSVAMIADYYDDIIVELAGGKRAKDVIEDYIN